MPARQSTAVRCELRGTTAHVVLDGPPLNILDLEAIADLDGHLETLSGEDSLHLVVLEGAGNRAFSAGVAVEDHVPEKLEEMLSSFHRVVRKLRSLPAVTLAMVRGHCLGGGCELATACDFVLAAEEASFGLPEVELGCFPPIAAALYPRLLGRGRALELLLTGRRFDGREGLALGLVTWSVPEAELDGARDRILETLCGKSAAVARLIKKAVSHGEEQDFDRALDDAEQIYLRELATTEDMREGLNAFLQRRAPRWRHR